VVAVKTTAIILIEIEIRRLVHFNIHIFSTTTADVVIAIAVRGTGYQTLRLMSMPFVVFFAHCLAMQYYYLR
jgi:hypothetical protein